MNGLIDRDLFPSLEIETMPKSNDPTSLLDDLSKRERQCHQMYEDESLSMGKIASKLGLSKSSVQTYIKRAREKLKQAT